LRDRAAAPRQPGVDAARGGQDRRHRDRVAEAVPLGQAAARAQPRAREADDGAKRRPIAARAGKPRAGGMTMKHDPSHAVLEDAQELGHEARAGSGDHAALRLWLRMLACTTQIETEIRRRLRERFGISLARFDYMAQLYRFKDGMKMSELSQLL